VALFCALTAYLGAVAVVLVLLIKVSFLVKLLVLGVAVLGGGLVFYCAARIAARPPAPEGLERVELFDIPVDRTDMAGALERIRRFVEERSPHMVVTSDSSAIVRSRSDQELREIMQGADLVTADGAGVVWAARVLGLPIWERVSGVDLMQRICELAAGHGYAVYLLGAEPGVAEAAAAKLQERYPGLRVAGTHHGYFTEEEEPALVEGIAGLHPDILFVAFGIPKQEKWIRRHLERLGVPVAVGVGGSFDVISGRVKRAPGWMQVAGLEWLYRTAREPKRFRRLAALPRFMMMALWERWRRVREGK
jgi:N-acetylglucosaminyldiphosphoundecaprenol N-acetyl-beta-D-mannosaminyltransferase